MKQYLWLVALLAFAASLALAQGGTATAGLLDRDGAEVGTATVTEEGGAIRIVVEVEGVDRPGAHGIHFRMFGRCDAPTVNSAGEHYNPTPPDFHYVSCRPLAAAPPARTHVEPHAARLSIVVSTSPPR